MGLSRRGGFRCGRRCGRRRGRRRRCRRWRGCRCGRRRRCWSGRRRGCRRRCWSGCWSRRRCRRRSGLRGRRRGRFRRGFRSFFRRGFSSRLRVDCQVPVLRMGGGIGSTGGGRQAGLRPVGIHEQRQPPNKQKEKNDILFLHRTNSSANKNPLIPRPGRKEILPRYHPQFARFSRARSKPCNGGRPSRSRRPLPGEPSDTSQGGFQPAAAPLLETQTRYFPVLRIL